MQWIRNNITDSVDIVDMDIAGSWSFDNDIARNAIIFYI